MTEIDERHIKGLLWYLDSIFNSPEARAGRFLKKVESASEAILPSNAQLVGGCHAGKRLQIPDETCVFRLYKPTAPLCIYPPGEMPSLLSVDDIETYYEDGKTLSRKRKFRVDL